MSADPKQPANDDSKVLSQEEMARKKERLQAKRVQTLKPVGKTDKPLIHQPSVKNFLQQGGKIMCLICKNEVTTKICGFCGSNEFKFMSAEEAPKQAKILKSGFLIKEGGGYKTWNDRYFELAEDKLLRYYTSDRKDIKQLFEERGKLKVDGAKIQSWERGCVATRDGYLFAITSTSQQGRTYILEAKTHEDREGWIMALRGSGAVWDGIKAMTKFNPKSILEGWMTKQGGRIKTWKRRYFVLLKGATVELQYWTATTEKKPKDVIHLAKEAIIERDNKYATIAIKTSPTADRRYLITAYDPRERDTWIQALQTALGQEYKAAPAGFDEKKQPSPEMQTRSVTSSGGSPSPNSSAPPSPNPPTSQPVQSLHHQSPPPAQGQNSNNSSANNSPNMPVRTVNDQLQGQQQQPVSASTPV